MRFTRAGAVETRQTLKQKNISTTQQDFTHHPQEHPRRSVNKF